MMRVKTILKWLLFGVGLPGAATIYVLIGNVLDRTFGVAGTEVAVMCEYVRRCSPHDAVNLA